MGNTPQFVKFRQVELPDGKKLTPTRHAVKIQAALNTDAWAEAARLGTETVVCLAPLDEIRYRVVGISASIPRLEQLVPGDQVEFSQPTDFYPQPNPSAEPYQYQFEIDKPVGHGRRRKSRVLPRD